MECPYTKRQTVTGLSNVCRGMVRYGAKTLKGHTGYVFVLELLPGGRLASGGQDKCIKVRMYGHKYVRYTYIFTPIYILNMNIYMWHTDRFLVIYLHLLFYTGITLHIYISIFIY